VVYYVAAGCYPEQAGTTWPGETPRAQLHSASRHKPVLNNGGLSVASVASIQVIQN